jgi:hypothetical protein
MINSYLVWGESWVFILYFLLCLTQSLGKSNYLVMLCWKWNGELQINLSLTHTSWVLWFRNSSASIMGPKPPVHGVSWDLTHWSLKGEYLKIKLEKSVEEKSKYISSVKNVTLSSWLIPHKFYYLDWKADLHF